MNYKTILAVLGAAALIIPSGLALANDGGQGILGSTGSGISGHAQVGLNVGLRGGDANENDNSSTSVDVEVGEHGNATSTERGDGKQGEKERGLHATTTLAGQAASSTNSHVGLGKGGIVGFFRWILGLPDTTTVGQIRADLTATTTASTTAGSSQGLGFWAQVLGFFHFGKGN